MDDMRQTICFETVDVYKLIRHIEELEEAVASLRESKDSLWSFVSNLEKEISEIEDKFIEKSWDKLISEGI